MRTQTKAELCKNNKTKTKNPASVTFYKWYTLFVIFKIYNFIILQDFDTIIMKMK